jgi:serine phosphatase RsbU (regulator of sigma subunit)
MVLSVVGAVLAALTAVYLVECIKECDQCNKKYWVLSLIFTLGGGIWSMHFIGMLAFSLPLPISYDLKITILSLIISIAGAGCAIYAIHGKEFNKERIYLGSLVLGIGISAMHYTGMQAMIIPAVMQFDYEWVGWSIVIAMTASWAALAVITRFGNQPEVKRLPLKLTSSFILGLGIAGMHYSGMKAIIFVSSHNPVTSLAAQANQGFLASSISVVTIIILGIGISASLAQARIKNLEKINVELEQRVSDRTKELKEKNLELDQALSQAIEYASLVQKGFLPESAPSFQGYTLSAKSTPARLVGGDFYDFIPLGENRLGILLGDVSGKGVNAALYMAKLISDFRSVSQNCNEPDLIMNEMNERLCRRSKNGMFATAIFCLLDMGKNSMSISNAGHPGLLIKEEKSVIHEKGNAHGPPLGILSEFKYSKEEISLKSGQLIFAYTDGVTEPKNSHHVQFGLKGLQSFLSQSEEEPGKLIDHLEKTIKQFVSSLEAQDDLTCLALKVS